MHQFNLYISSSYCDLYLLLSFYILFFLKGNIICYNNYAIRGNKNNNNNNIILRTIQNIHYPKKKYALKTM